MKMTTRIPFLGVVFRRASVFVALALSVASTAYAAPVTGQYVRVELLGEKLNNEPRYLSLAEVEVFGPACSSATAGCVNLGAGKVASQTQYQYDPYPASNALNGVSTDFTHTQIIDDAQRYNWWEVDLGAAVQIAHLRIKNRLSCCAARLNPARVLILDANRNLLWEGTINTTQLEYVFENIVLPATPPQTLNLLLNADFTRRTNPGLPDEWGVHKAFAQAVPNAQGLYFVNDTIAPPVEVPNAKVVEFDNTAGFYYSYFLPTKLIELRPAGKYTYSFYLRADAPKQFWVHKGFATFDDEKVLLTATTQWQRYSVTFTWTGNYRTQEMAPIIHMHNAGLYHIAAPQLEEGFAATAFHLAVEDQSPSPAKYINVDPEILAAANNPPVAQPTVKSVFENDFYTDSDSKAKLRIITEESTLVDLRCTVAGTSNVIWSKTAFVVSGMYNMGMSLGPFPVGQTYRCTVHPNNSGVVLAAAEFQRLAASAIEVRTNRFTGGLTVKAPPQTQASLFYVQGMDLHYNGPLSYFQDLKDHGINTIVYFSAVNLGLNTVNNNYADLNAVLVNAASVGLKVIIGVADDGRKTPESPQNLANFYALVDAFKSNPAIIGWYPLDEPDNTWTTADLLDIYDQIKQRDPYRFVLMNWAGDATYPSVGVGEEPLKLTGILGATDLFSRTGFYPFAFRKTMELHTTVALRTQRTARLFNIPTHSWLQLWGFLDASREPTLAEFRYMTYLNVLYGSMYSFFGTKSLSPYTWDNIGQLNSETNWLSANLVHNNNANEVVPVHIDPVQKNFLYSAWLKDSKTCYVIVAHNDNLAEQFSFDISSCLPGARKVQSKYENNRPVLFPDGVITEMFAPYQTRVFVIRK